MSKMRVPEMDVVRFKESDVIVASGLEASTIKLTLSVLRIVWKEMVELVIKILLTIGVAP